MIVRSRPVVGLLFLVAALAVSAFVPAGAAALSSGTIEGRVTDAVTTDGIEGVVVCAIDAVEFEEAGCEETGPDGEYTLGSLPDGGYVVEFWARYLGYETQYFDGKESFGEADEVTIAAGGTVSNVDAELAEGGKIAGRVTDAATNAGIEEVEVCAFSQSVFGGCAFTDDVGNYTIKGVPTGSYAVEFWAEFLGYETRYYNERPASEGTADLVSVVAPNTTFGINARLSKPAAKVPSSSSSFSVVPATPLAPPAKARPRSACKKGFKRVKRHGRKICVKKHKKKRRS
jgi:hypothetical protein